MSLPAALAGLVTERCGPVGFCIYCKRTDLPEGMARFSDEHVVPRALGGTLLLTEASCNSCAQAINAGFEGPFIKGTLGDIRHKHGTRSRHRKPGRGSPTIKVARALDGSSFEVPLADYPVCFPVYNFGTATLITGGPDQSVDANGWWEVGICEEDDFPEKYAAFVAKYPQWDQLFGFRMAPAVFARMIAKTAYGIAVSKLGHDAFDEEITPVILGTQPLFSRWVGGSREGYANIAPDETGYCLKLIPLDDHRGRLVIDYRLLKVWRKLRFHVVLGTIDFSNPLHRAALVRSGGSWSPAAAADVSSQVMSLQTTDQTK